MISDEEHLARILRPNWIVMGRVSSAAFNLRANISEAYISVLREHIESFGHDARKVSKEKSVTKLLTIMKKHLQKSLLVGVMTLATGQLLFQE